MEENESNKPQKQFSEMTKEEFVEAFIKLLKDNPDATDRWHRQMAEWYYDAGQQIEKVKKVNEQH